VEIDRFEGAREVTRNKFSIMERPPAPLSDQLAAAVDGLAALALGEACLGRGRRCWWGPCAEGGARPGALAPCEARCWEAPTSLGRLNLRLNAGLPDGKDIPADEAPRIEALVNFVFPEAGAAAVRDAIASRPQRTYA
jgi:hypothetical protein